MQKDLQMTDWLNGYTVGAITRNELEARIFRHLSENARQLHLHPWDDEEWIDYLCWLYPRIKKAIDSYRDTGSSFDAYITVLVRWSVKEYRSREADRKILEMAYWEAKSDESAREEEPEYDDHAPTALPCFGTRRQVLILALKCYLHVSRDFADRIARALDMEAEELTRLMDEVRKKRYERDMTIESLRERIGLQFYRCITYENRWAAAPEGSAHRAQMAESLRKARIRLDSMRRRLSGCRVDASNRLVAEVLGIPKGTVDSNLHALKWKWKTNQG